MLTHSGYEGRDDENENDLMSSSSIRETCAQSTPRRSSLSLSSSSSLSTISSPLRLVSEMILLSTPSSSSEEGEEFFLQSINKRIWKSLSTVSAVTSPSTASNSRGDSDEVESDLDLELGSEARISFDDVSELEPEDVIFYSTSDDSLYQQLQQQQEHIYLSHSGIMEEDDDEEPSGKSTSSFLNARKYVLDDAASSKFSRTMKASTPRSIATEQSRKTTSSSVLRSIASEHTRKTMASEPRSIATEHSRTTKASKPSSIATEQTLRRQQQQEEEDMFNDKDSIQLVRNIESELDLYGLDDGTTQKTDDDGHVVVDFGMSDDSSTDMPKISNDNCSMACTSITSSTSFERSITFSSFLDNNDNVENDDGDYNIIEFTTMVDPKTLRTTTKSSSNSDKKMIEEERQRDHHRWCVRYRKWVMFLFALILLGFSVVLVIELLRSRNMV